MNSYFNLHDLAELIRHCTKTDSQDNNAVGHRTLCIAGDPSIFVRRGEAIGTCETQGGVRDAGQREEVVGSCQDPGLLPPRLVFSVSAMSAVSVVSAGHSHRLR